MDEISTFLSQHAETLLGRRERYPAAGWQEELFSGKRVLITGGGGSIGSELCRQVAAHDIERLILLDVNENNAFVTHQKLRWEYPQCEIVIEIASVRDAARMRELFDRHRPQIVFHAAAHKHVSLMENCPAEAVKNNIFGTLHVADAAEEFGAERFVLISTDKAVEPVCVMGATKRFCEAIVASRTDSAVRFSTVRFGNVLGSAGSVLPSFVEAIRRGMALSVTDRNVARYFMTIPEASRLALRAAAFPDHAVYVFDMGEAIPIAVLAERVGACLGMPVKLVYTRLGAGEKLWEKLFYGEPLPTAEPLIFMEKPTACSREEIRAGIRLLADSCQNGEAARAALWKAVSAYTK